MASPRFSFGTSYPTLPTPKPKPTPAPQQPAPAPPAGMPPVPAAPAAGAPDWLHDFIAQILGPAVQQQGQNAAAQNQFRQDATFGRHLGIGGAASSPSNPMGNPGGDPFTNGFFSSPEERIAKERATFGGQSFTAGDRTAPTSAAMAGTQAPPQTMGHATSWMPFQGAQAPSFGSPVYRAQHPEYNMFADANFPRDPGSLLIGQQAKQAQQTPQSLAEFYANHVPAASYAAPPQANPSRMRMF